MILKNEKHTPTGATAEGGRPIGAPPKAAPVFLISLYHISALQTQVWLNPGFGLHFPARGTAPKHGFPKPGFGQTWVSWVLNIVVNRGVMFRLLGIMFRFVGLTGRF